MLKEGNKLNPIEQYDQWLQSEFNGWLARHMEMGHEDLIKNASIIYVDLYERNSAAYASDEYKAWAVKNRVFEIESLQIDGIFHIYNSDIGNVLKRAAAKREQHGFYIPIDSYMPRELRDSLKRKVDGEYEAVCSMFRCMDKKNLILHAYELTQLEMFRYALADQLNDLPLDKAELINLHYRHNLLETVFADNMGVTLDQLLSQTEMFPDLFEHFPSIRPDCPSHPREAFRQKVDDCYTKQIESWLKLTPGEFREQAHWIACVMDTHRRLTDDTYGCRQLFFMNRLKDPLTVVSTKWYAKKTWNPVQDYSEFSDCIDFFEAAPDENPQMYEPDSRYHTPEPQSPGMDQEVTMC